MAKIEAWEQRIRDEMEAFAHDLNTACQTALAHHAFEREKDPDGIRATSIDDPKLLEKLVEPARKVLTVGEMGKMVVVAVETEDEELLHKAMKPIVDFTGNTELSVNWTVRDARYRLTRAIDGHDDEHPFHAVRIVFNLDEYLNRYRDIVHLGSCHTCHKIYLKPKHGSKKRYCSRACQQRAYRERKAEKE